MSHAMESSFDSSSVSQINLTSTSNLLIFHLSTKIISSFSKFEKKLVFNFWKSREKVANLHTSSHAKLSHDVSLLKIFPYGNAGQTITSSRLQIEEIVSLVTVDYIYILISITISSRGRVHFHPKTISSTDTFIQKRFHPMTLSTKSVFIH